MSRRPCPYLELVSEVGPECDSLLGRVWFTELNLPLDKQHVPLLNSKLPLQLSMQLCQQYMHLM